MYRVDEVGIGKKPLSDHGAPEPVLDLLAGHVGMGQDADSPRPVRPLAGEDRELCDDQRCLASTVVRRFRKARRGASNPSSPISSQTLSISSSVISGIRESASGIAVPISGRRRNWLQRLCRHLLDGLQKIGRQFRAQLGGVELAFVEVLDKEFRKVLRRHRLGCAT